MLPAEPLTPGPADGPAVSARRAKDGPVPAGPKAYPEDAPTTEAAGDAAVAGEYEPL
ncbi:hypothetical protein LRD69_29075 [Streptomyces sp. JH14]|uniref:hypothetical protein n=1 Tax=Streptomyces sp. JH14 TaxID=2793630 RepID=UPI0023F71C35|nr:hypothetical protein [Streptomyces sp. JH14]MDF6046106.1 hypothetical protein [Streptomyces sp. JH14]